jgi:ribosomal protein S27AE
MDEKNKVNYDVSKFISHLNTKWQNKPCPMCGESNWSVSDKVFEMREFHGGNIVLGGGAIQPVIPVTCSNCGNSIMVNALVIGVINKPSVESKNKEAK